ncbi:hypothetical protein SPHI_21050 [Sphingomonas jeddahensis]|uniref:Uncharacterized protein n=1 Tax=Sphingomonas jeddahensis TaxID=1915074 RepID=A0A1V2ETN6_9SPHN|nr:hypothetical protein SPHI_21050 [Sphingomonas jeddahensis]
MAVATGFFPDGAQARERLEQASRAGEMPSGARMGGLFKGVGFATRGAVPGERGAAPCQAVALSTCDEDE